MNTNNRNTALYFVVPVALLAAFTFLYQNHSDAARIQAAALAEMKAQAAAVEAAKQAELEASLELQSKALAEAKAKALADKEETIRQEKASLVKDAEDRLSSALQDSERLAKDLDELETKLAADRSARLQTEAELVAVSLEIANLSAERSAADLEAQRLTAMLSSVVTREIDLAKAAVPAQL